MLGGSIEQESEEDRRESLENESWRSKSHPDHPASPSSGKLSADHMIKLPPARVRTLTRHDASTTYSC